jgi:hypothetical protein
MVASLVLMLVIQQKTTVAWPWYTLIGTLITLAVAGLMRIVTRESGPARH